MVSFPPLEAPGTRDGVAFGSAVPPQAATVVTRRAEAAVARAIRPARLIGRAFTVVLLCCWGWVAQPGYCVVSSCFSTSRSSGVTSGPYVGPSNDQTALIRPWVF